MTSTRTTSAPPGRTARQRGPAARLGTGAATALTVLLVAASPAAAGPAPVPVDVPGRESATPAPATAETPHDAETVLVRFRTVVTEPGQQQVAADAGAELGEDVGASGWTRVDTGGRDPDVVLAELARDPAVAQAELDPVRTIAATPTDPLFPRQSGLAALRVPAAWDVTTGSASTVIAVLDTGVDGRHPDLAGRLLPGTDVVNRDGDASDDNGHGTGVAGAAAASAGNGVGIAGVDWRARVLPVKVLGANGEGRDSDIAEGVRWAVDHGATVVNLSLGGGDQSTVLADAVAYALTRGAVVVAAAGNSGRQELSYPAAYPGVVAVAATDDSGASAAFSTGGDWVDVAAPGVRVGTLGLSAHTPYVTMTGTSFASPLVAGVAGLVRAANPTWDPVRVHDWLRTTARDVGAPGHDARTGAGLVDAAAAVRASATTASTTAIDERYARLGGTRSVLGNPVTAELPTPDGVGRFRHHERGSIYWTAATGAQEVFGAIRDRWASLGWERSVLRYPATGELGTPDRRGRFNHFQGGSVYWTAGTGAQAVYGAIRDRWAALGWERGSLGYPTRSEYDVPGGRASDFERGRITWDRASGRVTVTSR